MSYPDQYNPDLLDRIPVDARVVLDVGCASGALGAEYKLRNPSARFLGIEQDHDAARLAATRLDQVFIGNIDAADPFSSTDIPAGTVDCLIYGDVLEHLIDPWKTLARHVALLSECALVLVCMPNSEHWSFAERLIRGTWDYEDNGLFDRTHLRWFTAPTVRHMLQTSGLSVVDCTPRIFDLPSAAAFVDALTPALARLGVDRSTYLHRAAPIQHVWRATQARHDPPLPLVSTMLSPLGGVSHVRVVEPLAALAADTRFRTAIIGTNEEPSDEAGIFIFHRPLLAGEQGLQRIRNLIRDGWIVLCEFDDHPDYIPVLQRPEVHNFRAVHGIQTTTEPLAEVLGRQNPEVAVFPNGIARLPEVQNFANPDSITLFFAGLNRQNEWPPFLAALNAVAQRAGSRVHFRILNDRGLFESLQTPHKTFVPLCDYQSYQAHLGASDISFMPLLDTPFNRCKSDLKFIEAAAHRAVALASPTVYGDVIADGQTGVIFRDEVELEQKLMRLVANPEVARGIGSAARAYVTEHRMLGAQTSRRAAWYMSVWRRREALRQSLRVRVPELDL